MDTMWDALIPNSRGGQWAVTRTDGGYCWGMAADNEILTRGGDVFATAELAARDMLANAGKYILWHDGYRLLDLCRNIDARELERARPAGE